MGVYKDKRSQFWQYDFRYRGERFCGSTECTTETDAEEALERLKAKAVLGAGEKKNDFNRITLEKAANLWLDRRGSRHKNSGDALHDVALLVERLGAGKRVAEISDDDVARLVEIRRGDFAVRGGKKSKQRVSNATVNRTVIQRLRPIYLYMVKLGMRPATVPDWRTHRVKEAKAKNREIRAEDIDAILAAYRDDHLDYLDFARLTGQRQMECVVKWTEVDFAAGIIALHDGGKGDEPVTIPITPAVRVILERQRGHHPVWVFTYVCQRTRRHEGHIRGQRYPLTREGIATEWQRARKAAGCAHVRFHDLRHDFGSKLMRETRNPNLVQRLMNHRNVATTMRYLHHTTAEELAAVTAFQEKSRRKSRSPVKAVG